MKKFKWMDMEQLVYIAEPSISEDGKHISYTRYKGYADLNMFRSEIVLTDRAGSVLTVRQGRMPKFAGNDRLLYISKESGTEQIWEMDLLSGEGRKLTSLRHGVIRYSVNGAYAAFEAVLWPKDKEPSAVFTELSEEEEKSFREQLKHSPCTAENLVYKLDDWHGMRHGEYSHTGWLNLKTGECRLVESEGVEYCYPAVSSDGRKLAFYGYPHNGARGREAEAFIHDISSGTTEILTNQIGIYADHFPMFTSDNEAVITAGYPLYEDGSTLMIPYHIRLSNRQITPLWDDSLENICHGIHPMPVCRSEFGENSSYLRLNEKDELIFMTSLRGQAKLCRMDVKAILGSLQKQNCIGSEKEPAGTEKNQKEWISVLFENDSDILSFAEKQGSTVLVLSDPARPGELFHFDYAEENEKENLTNGSAFTTAAADNTQEGFDSGFRDNSHKVMRSLKQLTCENQWISEYSLGTAKRYHTESRDKAAELDYWILYPPQYEETLQKDPEKRYGAVLYLKGGPETTHNNSFWHEFQALAGENLIVIYGNPRGSVGYGRSFCNDAVCWKPEAMEDCISMLEAAGNHAAIDVNRVGVTGGSYGGYMTMKLLGRTKLFAAACAQRPLVNPVTSYGTGDMGFISAGSIPEDFTMKAFLEDRARGNILTYVDNMKVPLLILHGAEDYRCGFEQAEQLFVTMKQRNPEIPVRLVRFPGENHGVSRTGRIVSQLRHLKELTQWMKHYLEGENA